jgi:hypothetical protein
MVWSTRKKLWETDSLQLNSWLDCCLAQPGTVVHAFIVPVLRTQRQDTQLTLWVGGQSGLQSEFQDSQDGYAEKPCVTETKKK